MAKHSHNPSEWIHESKIIEITPDLERRIQAERRREPREKIASMERRLADIASIIRSCEFPEDCDLPTILDIAEGRL